MLISDLNSAYDDSKSTTFTNGNLEVTTVGIDIRDHEVVRSLEGVQTDIMPVIRQGKTRNSMVSN